MEILLIVVLLVIIGMLFVLRDKNDDRFAGVFDDRAPYKLEPDTSSSAADVKDVVPESSAPAIVESELTSTTDKKTPKRKKAKKSVTE
jgi:uncharacterized protein YxeA